MRILSVERGLQRLLVLGWVVVICGSASCLAVPALSEARIRVLVHGGNGPVAGALVEVWCIDDDGYSVGANERPGESMDAVPAMVEGRTDADGYVELGVGACEGSLYLRATGGTVVEFIGSGQPPALYPVPKDVLMRAIVAAFMPYDDTIQELTISPFTALAVAVGEGRLASEDRRYIQAMHRAQEELGEHLGDIDIALTHPATSYRADGAGGLLEDERYLLILTAFADLAQSMADESGFADAQFWSLDLLRALLSDAWDGQGLLDGQCQSGLLSVAACVKPSGCLPEIRTGACKTVCDLDGNTLRMDLANAIVYRFLPSDKNVVSLTFNDVRLLAEGLVSREAPLLFGAVQASSILGPAPIIEVEPTFVGDESDDIVSFSGNAMPRHEPSGARIEIGAEGECPTVYKHVHRLESDDSNAIRWRFTVRDRSGAGVPEDRGGQYRVCRGGLATEWMQAEPIASMGKGDVQYEAVVVRSHLSLLGEQEDIYRIEFRGFDAFERESEPVSRCWQLVLLAAPLEVGETVEVFDGDSLHAVGLEPGKMPLAPLLNGISVSEGLSVMEFTVRNGTREPVYLSLDYEQPTAVASKDWILTSALLHIDDIDAPSCIPQGTCPTDWPAHILSVDPNPVAVAVPAFIDGIRAWDVSSASGVPVELLPCDACGTNEFLIPEHRDPSHPTTIRFRVVVSHLGELAPRSTDVGEAGGERRVFYEDVPIDPEFYPTIITGERYEYDDVVFCQVPGADGSSCLTAAFYAYYRALTAASLSVGEIVIIGRTRPSLAIPARIPISHDGVFGTLDSFSWTTVEQPLPAPHPQPE